MNLKMKDFVLLALLTALYIIVYFVAMMIISLMGPFGHAISPGVCGLLSLSLIHISSDERQGCDNRDNTKSTNLD